MDGDNGTHPRQGHLNPHVEERLFGPPSLPAKSTFCRGTGLYTRAACDKVRMDTVRIASVRHVLLKDGQPGPVQLPSRLELHGYHQMARQLRQTPFLLVAKLRHMRLPLLTYLTQVQCGHPNPTWMKVGQEPSIYCRRNLVRKTWQNCR